MPKVSLIIPVYNVENYIEKCLDSVINQTLKDIEIIIVNDGPKDTSKEKIEKYLKKYPSIKYLEKENGDYQMQEIMVCLMLQENM